jgi:hypothetical protein
VLLGDRLLDGLAVGSGAERKVDRQTGGEVRGSSSVVLLLIDEAVDEAEG